MKRRDPEVWRRLAYLYGPLVYHWCRRRGLRTEDAEDVVQEVLLAVAAKVASFRRDRPGDTFRGWLWGITRHKLGDWLWRTNGRERPLSEVKDPRACPGAAENKEGPSDSASAAAVGDLYRRALGLIRAEFEERSWQAFWRVAVEGQKAANVAADLNMSRNVVYLAKSRILSRFHEVLRDG